MIHLQQENKKLKNEIEDKKIKAGHQKLCSKAICPSKVEPTQKGKVCGMLGWRGTPQDLSPRLDFTKYLGLPHCSGTPGTLSVAVGMSSFVVP